MDALALVRLRLLQLADASSSLTDKLLVDSGHREQRLRLRSNRELNALGWGDGDRVREAQGELQVLALSNHAVTGTRDLEVLLVALGHANNHVGDEGTGQSVKRT